MDVSGHRGQVEWSAKASGLIQKIDIFGNYAKVALL